MAYLAGDIGGTKTHLALYKEERGKVICLKEEKFPSQKYPNLRLIVKEFLKETTEEIAKGCFGIAGPVKKGKSQATNLPWLVESEALSKELTIEKVSLINDLEANAYGLNMLKEEEFFTLNEGDRKAEGNKALVSAGTGLGEAGIFFDGKKDIPFACEGGHADFAPINEREDSLLRFLRKKFGHVSYERILSGPGLYNVYQFIVETRVEKEREEVLKEIAAGDSPRLISEKGLSGESRACKKALELFISIYGSEAGNVALKMFALGGIYIGGGIAPKLLSIIKLGGFLDSFKRKGRFSDLLGGIPIRVVLNDKTALLGAAYYAKYVM
ncbi:MAG: glucokinase [Simkaniaceae bacterium]|jgi:glucokinase|nr:MAG: glucokinase [Simkaniaceae bacterium]